MFGKKEESMIRKKALAILAGLLVIASLVGACGSGEPYPSAQVAPSGLVE